MPASSYVWTEPYQAAVLELDSEKLLTEITKAEAVIQQRQAELLQALPTGGDELEAIARALRVLSQLREIEHRSS